MTKLLKTLPLAAILWSVFAVPLPSAQAENNRTPAAEAKGDKPAPKPPKPVGPPKSGDE